jgi:CBS domain containing-hemolysin-like protein
VSEWVAVVLITLAVMASAFFSGAETGLVSVNRIRLRARARMGQPGSRRLSKILSKQEKALSTVLVGNNITVVGGSAVATVLAQSHFASAGPALATVVMSALLMVFGEIVPKSYFRARADTIMLRAAQPLYGVFVVLRPVVEATSKFTGLLFMLLRKQRKSTFVTREELRLIVRESGREGVLRLWQKRMLEGVFELGSTVVREVMIPLPDVVSISEDANVETLKALLRSKGHTRFPVYRGRVDEISGLLNVFDVLFSQRRIQPGASVKPFIRPIPVIPETKRIDILLYELQRERAPMAVIVNEFGACIGIVTVEDIVEEITGEMTDEHERAELKIRPLGKGVFLLDAKTDIDDINAELELRLPKERYDTVGGLVLKSLGRIPEVGEKVTVGGVTFEVMGVHKFGIKTIKAILPKSPRSGGGSDGGGGSVEEKRP